MKYKAINDVQVSYGGGMHGMSKFLRFNLFPFIVLGLLGRDSFAALKRRFTALYVFESRLAKTVVQKCRRRVRIIISILINCNPI